VEATAALEFVERAPCVLIYVVGFVRELGHKAAATPTERIDMVAVIGAFVVNPVGQNGRMAETLIESGMAAFWG
jgi:hypothetical protein